MPERSERRKPIPSWAERERARDVEWLGENLHIFWPAAQTGFAESGRGALVADTTTRLGHEGGESNPFVYLAASAIAEHHWGDVIRMVKEYAPGWKFVAVVLKWDRESAYRIGVPSQKK